MLTLSTLIPGWLKEYRHLLATKARYPDATINSCRVSPGARIGVAVEISRDVVVGDDVVIGDYSYVNAGAMVASGTIGKFCSVGFGAHIGQYEHPTTHLSTSPFTYSCRSIMGLQSDWCELAAPPVVGNDVWIGCNAVILQRVTVGDGAVIAAGAVVTKDVEPYAIVAGVPAKVIRFRFDPSIVSELEQIRWWDSPLVDLLRIRHAFVREFSPDLLTDIKRLVRTEAPLVDERDTPEAIRH